MRLQIDSNRQGVDYVGPVPPSAPSPGYLWFDTVNNKLKSWNGLYWRWGGSEPFVFGGDAGFIHLGYTTVMSTSIQKISFPFESGTSTVASTLTVGIAAGSGVNSSTNGYIMGGATTNSLGGPTSQVTRTPFDLLSSSVVCSNIVNAKYWATKFNSSKYGYSCGGITATSSIDRMCFPFDISIGIVDGALSSASGYGSGFNSSLYGYICGNNATSSIERKSLSNDGSSTLMTSTLTLAKMLSGTVNSSTYGYCAGGFSSGYGAYYSTVDRCIFPFDGGASKVTSNTPVISPYREGTAVNSVTAGFISFGTYSYIHRFAFPFDSGVTNSCGNTSGTGYHHTGFDNTDFVTQFV